MCVCVCVSDCVCVCVFLTLCVCVCVFLTLCAVCSDDRVSDSGAGQWARLSPHRSVSRRVAQHETHGERTASVGGAGRR